MTKELLCKDCRHSFVPLANWIILTSSKYKYECRKSLMEGTVKYNPVTGDEWEGRRYQSCSVFRMGISNSNNCGTDARFWEPRDKQGIFKLIKHSDR